MSMRNEAAPNLADRQQYVRATRERVCKVMITIEKVRARLKGKLAMSELSVDDQLEKSELRMDALFAAVQKRLSEVEIASDDDWMQRRDSVENAWEDLTRSINQIVSHVV